MVLSKFYNESNVNRMNQQNMQQFYEQQSMNGFPGSGPAGFQGSSQVPPSSYNGSTPTTNRYRLQNGMPRYSQNDESFEMQSPQNAMSQHQQTPGNYPNFMDPRMSGFDPRSRPSYEPPPNGMVPGMEGYNPNMYSKLQMSEMAGLFSNAAALQQRQRMNLFVPGRENVSINFTE